MKVVLQIALICALIFLSSSLKCQVCEGGPSPGVCQDPDDKGVSKECQSWETACFFTKTGTTTYRRRSTFVPRSKQDRPPKKSDKGAVRCGRQASIFKTVDRILILFRP